MQLHELKSSHRVKAKPAVGRGGKRGKTSGRGTKGQKARAGHKIRPEIRDVIKKIPKRRGYRFASHTAKPAVVNLATLERFVPAGEVTPTLLTQEGIVRKHNGRTPQVKILGNGTLTKKLTVSACLVSKSAREKIEKAGGTITE